MQVNEKIVEPLLIWYSKNKRDLPWRNNISSYRTWISEIMLQQTRVEAVIPYFNRFLEKLPNIKALADIPEDELLKLWEGLGYYSRARNLQKTARMVMESGLDELPDHYEQLIKFPGIGSYTAGAISSIVGKEQSPAVDGNVFRVISRVMEDDSNISKPNTKKQLEENIKTIIPKENPGDFNQAIMELGATICIPNGMPRCNICPLNTMCNAYKNGTMLKYPVKDKKKEKKEIDLTNLVYTDGKKIGIQKRPDKGLLASLYEFPNEEKKITMKELKQKLIENNTSYLKIKKLTDYIHIFTHLKWQVSGYVILVSDIEEVNHNLIWITIDQLERDYTLPSAFLPHFEEYKNKIAVHK